jgi:hypothetical protein
LCRFAEQRHLHRLLRLERQGRALLTRSGNRCQQLDMHVTLLIGEQTLEM